MPQISKSTSAIQIIRGERDDDHQTLPVPQGFRNPSNEFHELSTSTRWSRGEITNRCTSPSMICAQNTTNTTPAYIKVEHSTVSSHHLSKCDVKKKSANRNVTITRVYCLLMLLQETIEMQDQYQNLANGHSFEHFNTVARKLKGKFQLLYP